MGLVVWTVWIRCWIFGWELVGYHGPKFDQVYILYPDCRLVDNMTLRILYCFWKKHMSFGM